MRRICQRVQMMGRVHIRDAADMAALSVNFFWLPAKVPMNLHPQPCVYQQAARCWTASCAWAAPLPRTRTLRLGKMAARSAWSPGAGAGEGSVASQAPTNVWTTRGCQVG